MWESFDNSIKEIPIRRIDFQKPEDRALHHRVVQLAAALEDASERANEAASAGDRSIAARRAEGLGDQLDELVLNLYGVTARSDRAEVLARGAPLA
jgi:hypothetical protein